MLYAKYSALNAWRALSAGFLLHMSYAYAYANYSGLHLFGMLPRWPQHPGWPASGCQWQIKRTLQDRPPEARTLKGV